jgi:hypothetical protein
MGYNEKIMEADRLDVSPYDIDMQVRTEVEDIVNALKKEMK